MHCLTDFAGCLFPVKFLYDAAPWAFDPHSINLAVQFTTFVLMEGRRGFPGLSRIYAVKSGILRGLDRARARRQNGFVRTMALETLEANCHRLGAWLQAEKNTAGIPSNRIWNLSTLPSGIEHFIDRNVCLQKRNLNPQYHWRDGISSDYFAWHSWKIPLSQSEIQCPQKQASRHRFQTRYRTHQTKLEFGQYLGFSPAKSTRVWCPVPSFISHNFATLFTWIPSEIEVVAACSPKYRSCCSHQRLRAYREH